MFYPVLESREKKATFVKVVERNMYFFLFFIIDIIVVVSMFFFTRWLLTIHARIASIPQSPWRYMLQL
jgi:hypothetical protein